MKNCGAITLFLVTKRRFVILLVFALKFAAFRWFLFCHRQHVDHSELYNGISVALFYVEMVKDDRCTGNGNNNC